MPTSRMPEPNPMRSIREPGASPRNHRQDAGPAPRLLPPARSGSTPPARAPRSRPDPNPLRLMVGFAGLASAAAFTTAMLPSVTPQVDAAQTTDQPVAAAVVEQPAPSVQHVTKYVTLQPGQTAPPQSTVIVRPKPTPKVTVKVVTKTRQSGKP